MSRKHYPSDISREQFEQIRSMLEGIRHKTRHQQHGDRRRQDPVYLLPKREIAERQQHEERGRTWTTTAIAMERKRS